MKAVPVRSEISGTVWKIESRPGVEFEADDVLLILESMKMEIPVTAPRAGTVVEIYFAEGEVVGEGEVVATIE